MSEDKPSTLCAAKHTHTGRHMAFMYVCSYSLNFRTTVQNVGTVGITEIPL